MSKKGYILNVSHCKYEHILLDVILFTLISYTLSFKHFDWPIVLGRPA